MRRWRDEDREPFAAMNADPDVMRMLPKMLSRDESDAMVDRIEQRFEELGYGLWAVEITATGEFIGFVGLALQTYDAPFTPAVEVGWRLSSNAWGHGYATEAARRALAFGFTEVGLAEIVSMTSVPHTQSQAVMRRIGLTRDLDGDFDYPNLPEGHPLRRHVLYRLSREQWLAALPG